MKQLSLAQVSCRGGGITIGAEKVWLKLTFACPFTKKLAEALDLQFLYNGENGGGLRPFADHKTGIKFDEANITFAKTEDERVDPLRLTCPVDGFEVVREDKTTMLKFSIQVPITTIEMITYIQDQKREPALMVEIEGTQAEFDFNAAPKKRGRPKKDKAA